MVRIIIGGIILFLCACILGGMAVEPEDVKIVDLIILFFFLFVPGMILLISGIIFKINFNKVVETCLQRKDNENTLELKEISKDLSLPLMKVNKYIIIAKQKGHLPPKIKVS